MNLECLLLWKQEHCLFFPWLHEGLSPIPMVQGLGGRTGISNRIILLGVPSFTLGGEAVSIFPKFCGSFVTESCCSPTRLLSFFTSTGLPKWGCWGIANRQRESPRVAVKGHRAFCWTWWLTKMFISLCHPCSFAIFSIHSTYSLLMACFSPCLAC